MFPLWIIDLNNDDSQRASLKSRVEKLRVFDEQLKRDDKTSFFPKADWCYTSCHDVDLASEDWLDQLINKLVKEGQEYVRYLLAHSPSNECLANICVIGNVEEEYSLKLFSSIAALIKKDKGRIIPDHVHQGINIIGFLYVPSNVNALPYEKRQSVLRCLKELEIQGKVNRISGYERIVLYQDTQHRTQKYYPALNPERRTEFLFQCLINMFYACDASHPLFSGKNDTEDYFVSMGVGSLFYEPKKASQDDVILAANNFLKTLKANPTVESEDQSIRILDPDKHSPEEIVSLLSNVRNDEDDAEDILYSREDLVDAPDPDPVEDFKTKFLKRYYYGLYLRLFPTKFVNKLLERIEDSTSDLLVRINDKVGQAYVQVAKYAIPTGLRDILKDKTSVESGCFTLVKKKFENLKVYFIKCRDNKVEPYVEEIVWKPFITKRLPKRYRDYFVDYHDAYNRDLHSGSGTECCDKMKRDTMARLVALLKKEPTVLSMVARAFMMGMMLVLVTMPVFELWHFFKSLGKNFNLSTLLPYFKEGHIEFLSDPQWYYFLIASCLFIVPALILLLCYMMHGVKVRRQKDRLLAFYLHDCKARAANRIITCVREMYTDLADLCSEYISRCDTIIDESRIVKEEEQTAASANLLDVTMFNQPISGGRLYFRFDEEQGQIIHKIFPENGNSLSLFSINGGMATRVDHISTTQFYSIAHSGYTDLMELFQGVELMRRVAPDKNSENGENVDKTAKELEAEKAAAWEKAKMEFSHNIIRRFKAMQLPVGEPSMAEKVRTLHKNGNAPDFERFVKFCAPNGEFTNNDDVLYADVKSNSTMSVREAFSPYLPQDGRTDFQSDDKYKSYIFLTQWRGIDEFALRRTLPELDLDNKEFFFKSDYDIEKFHLDDKDGGSYRIVDDEGSFDEFLQNIKGPVSSLLLYSLIGDSSSEWLEIFSKASFAKVDRVAEEKYGKVLAEKR